MYIYFTVFGILFTSVFASITNYMYDLFPINKITNFFAPLGGGIWHKINALTLPTILWSFIEVPVLGDLSFFFLSVILNVCIQCSIMYVIKYSSLLIFKNENNFINLISIFVASVVGFFLAYLIFIISSVSMKYMLVSIISLLLIMCLYIVVIYFPPKSEFFRGN